jgi:hypothetical protein
VKGRCTLNSHRKRTKNGTGLHVGYTEAIQQKNSDCKRRRTFDLYRSIWSLFTYLYIGETSMLAAVTTKFVIELLSCHCGRRFSYFQSIESKSFKSRLAYNILFSFLHWYCFCFIFRCFLRTVLALFLI